jgi:hypothetical protein
MVLEAGKSKIRWLHLVRAMSCFTVFAEAREKQADTGRREEMGRRGILLYKKLLLHNSSRKQQELIHYSEKAFIHLLGPNISYQVSPPDTATLRNEASSLVLVIRTIANACCM